ncbi:MAG TPA: hypothetical protein IAC11_11270 [Candidatus Limiplasma pullicola]|nr:hypothetical protein [Candidatus Limiplasma pullicola]
MRLPITKERIRNHFHYAWWQYVLLVCLAVFGWNLLYTTTRYRSPESLKVEWYCQGLVDTQAQEELDALMEQLRLELFPEMEEVTFTAVAYDQTYGDMQLMVWVSAGQGDLYMLEREQFENLASAGAMAPLTPYIESGALQTGEIDLTAGYVTDPETGEKYLMGVPTDSLTGLQAYGIDPEGHVLSLLSNGGNLDNTVKLMQWLIDNMQ